jgi:hypothetical protein
MTDVDLTRRRLLIAAAGVAAAIAAGPSGLLTMIERLTAADASSLLRGLISDREGAARLGRLYLAAHPTEARTGVLVRDLLGPTEPTSVIGASREVAARIRGDFAAGSTVVVDGWVLSRAEARLYALVALG